MIVNHWIAWLIAYKALLKKAIKAKKICNESVEKRVYQPIFI